MNIIYKILKLNRDKREDVVTATSLLNIVVNLLISTLKVVIGLLTASIAIISEGLNNASDVLTSVLALVGTKIAGKHPDSKHPFGYGRIEYLTSLIVSMVIIITGIQTLITSVNLIFNPESISISYLSLAILFVSAIAKFICGTYTIAMGKKADSNALVGVGLDCRNDTIMSAITIVSAIVFLVFHFSIDAYAGTIISFVIIKVGVEVLRDTISELIGRPGEKELAAKLYKEIRGTKGVLAAVDMMLHNYGPASYSGSVNIEVDHEMSVGEIYQTIHALQLRIMHEYNVTMVFGIYAVDNDHAEVKEIRRYIGQFVANQEHIKSFHALYLEPGTNDIYIDFIVDYELQDWDKVRVDFDTYMSKQYPDSKVVLTIETEYV